MKTVVFATSKGGVGKTTLALHYAWFLQEKKQRVLFLDIDAQGNSAKTLSAHHCDVQSSSLFLSDPPVLQPDDEGMCVLQADRKLNDLDRMDAKEIITRFRASLEANEDNFDYCVIDAPAAFGYRTVAALISANYVVSPIELDTFAIDGIVELLKNINGVKDRFNEDLVFLGMLANRLNANSTKQKDSFEELVKGYASYLIPAKVGLRSSIPDAMDESMPVWKLNRTSARVAAKEMRAALEYVFDRMN